jgi:hypothetical protein
VSIFLVRICLMKSLTKETLRQSVARFLNPQLTLFSVILW